MYREWHAKYSAGYRGLWRARWVEWRNNQVRLNGCTFSVGDPFVSDRAKATLWSGSYEAAERRALDYIDPTLPVVELGANIGVVACLTNKRLAPGTSHVVVEADSRILPTLIKNREQNHCSFHILPKALGYGAEEMQFIQRRDSLGSALGNNSAESVLVATTTLRDILTAFGIDRFTLICDIEGAEEPLLLNEGDVLKRHARMIVMEVHPEWWGIGQERVDRLLARVHELGFRTLWSVPNHVYCWVPSE